MLYADSPIDASLLSLYIHQNYTQYCNELDECGAEAELLSWVDYSGGETVKAFPEFWRYQAMIYSILIVVSNQSASLSSRDAWNPSCTPFPCRASKPKTFQASILWGPSKCTRSRRWRT